MKRILGIATLFMLLAGSLHAQPQFVYVNNGTSPFNSISAFSIGPGGTLATLPGSPYATGGEGAGGFYATNRITTCIVRNHLYVTNDASSTISVMTINAATGALSPVLGSPFPSGGASGAGLSLAVTPDDRFLYCTNAGSSNVSVFTVAASGVLSPIPGSPFPLPSNPDGIKITPNGKFLLIALPNANPPSVAVYSLAANGTPAAVPGSPFPGGGGGTVPTGVDADCDGSFVFAAEANFGRTVVSAFNQLANGSLSPVAGSPFGFLSGSNSNVGVLSTDDRFLFLSNQDTNTLTVLAVAPNGSLSLVPGSPFANPGGSGPTLISVDPKGSYLYVANDNGRVTGHQIAANGSLSPVPGSPFLSGAAGRAGVAVFPPKNCVQICTPNNVAPVFDAPTPVCGSSRIALVGTPVSFSVAASDADSGDVVTLSAAGVPGGATWTPSLPASGNPIASTFNWTPGLADQGNHLVTFIANDLCGHATRCSTSIQVTTNRNPDCSLATPSERNLWPPNHRYHSIQVLGVTDPDGDPVTVTVTGVTMDEPPNGRGDGATCPDALLVNGQVSVRAERTGTPGIPGNGRVYGISYRAEDGRGGQCTGVVYVGVPHNEGVEFQDDGQVYSPLGPCNKNLALSAFELQLGTVAGGQAHVTFTLPEDATVDVTVFDLAGRRLATLENSQLPMGVYERVWNMEGVSDGLYYVRMRTGKVSLTKTLLKVR